MLHNSNLLSHGHTLYHFPCFHSLSSPKLSFSFHFPSPYSGLNPHHKFRCSTIFASSVNKFPRASRKPKTDEELCNDIKDFLYSAGFPENHVPTMKELSLPGRQNLANIVRRRGYKFIKQLLETSSTTNFIASDTYTGQTGNFEMLGQAEKQSGLFVEVPSDESTEKDTNSCIDEEVQMNDQSSVPVESSSLQEKTARFMQLRKLDETEDGASGIANGQKADEVKKSEIEHSNETEFAFSILNGNVPSSALEVKDPAFETATSRENYISTREQTNTSGEELNDEKVENQIDIKHLRYLLHKKELELIQLKEEIEKEKFEEKLEIIEKLSRHRSCGFLECFTNTFSCTSARFSVMEAQSVPVAWEVQIPPNAVRRKRDPTWRGGFSLGVDLGLSRTGIAISKGFQVRPLTVIELRGQKLELRLIDLAEKQEVDEFIIGLPKSSDGTETDQSNKVRSVAGRFAVRAAQRGWRVYLQDEYGTSSEALDHMIAKRLSRCGRERQIDAYAAMKVLERYFSQSGNGIELVVPKQVELRNMLRKGPPKDIDFFSE